MKLQYEAQTVLYRHDYYVMMQLGTQASVSLFPN